MPEGTQRQAPFFVMRAKHCSQMEAFLKRRLLTKNAASLVAGSLGP